ncbi:MAG: hypothetical protein IJD96_08555 [Lachnospiraceae bacterium]|nr:hypothetical protein [Lachnospiraceae bacterium]
MAKLKQSQQQGGLSTGRRMLNTLWVVVMVVSFVTLIGTLFGHMEELGAVQWGASIVADYKEEGGRVYAEYYDENGQQYLYNLAGHDPIVDGDKVTLYYTTSLSEATPRNTLGSYIGYYVVFGALFGVSLWKLRKMAEGNHTTFS